MVQELGTLPIKLFGTDELKQRFLPKCASRRVDARPSRCPSPTPVPTPAGCAPGASRDGDEWVIDGTKNWITNLGVADFYIVFAVTEPRRGPLARDLARSSSRPTARLLGRQARAQDGHPRLAHRPADLRRRARAGGEPDRRRRTRASRSRWATLDRSRLGVAAQAVGIAQGATDYAAAYAQERQQFGKPIAAFQGIQFKLADMETRTAAGPRAALPGLLEGRRGEPDMGKYSAMAKLFASDTAMGVTIEAVQVLGGYGYVNEYPVERMMRDAKITQIYEGTNEIQRLVIAAHDALVASPRSTQSAGPPRPARVVERPAEPLDEVVGEELGLQLAGVDPLAVQHCRVSLCVVGANDDLGHVPLLFVCSRGLQVRLPAFAAGNRLGNNHGGPAFAGCYDPRVARVTRPAQAPLARWEVSPA